jgi:hypothetical protein
VFATGFDVTAGFGVAARLVVDRFAAAAGVTAGAVFAVGVGFAAGAVFAVRAGFAVGAVFAVRVGFAAVSVGVGASLLAAIRAVRLVISACASAS